MKLYYAPGACSLAPHIAALEAGLALDLAKVEFGPDGKTAEGRDYLEINPKGAVPALRLDGGEVLTEAAVILQYLAARAPAAGLAPRGDGIEHWRFLEWLNFIATELHKGFGPLWNPAITPEWRAAAVANLEKKFAFLDSELGGRDWIAGEAFTAADAYAFTILNWAGHHRIDLSPWPNVIAFQKRVAARPAVQQALRAEGLI